MRGCEEGSVEQMQIYHSLFVSFVSWRGGDGTVGVKGLRGGGPRPPWAGIPSGRAGVLIRFVDPLHPPVGSSLASSM